MAYPPDHHLLRDLSVVSFWTGEMDSRFIAPLTDPAWTPLFLAVDGVVVNVGGQISHAVIVSRELGLPCVVSVADATERIPDGATIELDGATGEVTIVALP